MPDALWAVSVRVDTRNLAQRHTGEYARVHVPQDEHLPVRIHRLGEFFLGALREESRLVVRVVDSLLDSRLQVIVVDEHSPPKDVGVRQLHSAGVQGASGCLVTEPAGEFLQLRQFHALVLGKPDRLPEGFVGAGYQFADALLQFFVLLRKPVELVLHCFKRVFCHNSTYLVYQEKTAHAGFSGSSIIVSPFLSDANGLSYR